MYTGKFGHLHDSDIYDPFDVQELFSGDGERDGNSDYNYEDEEHIGPVGIYGPKISENKFFLENQLNKNRIDNEAAKRNNCNGDKRFCKLRYDQITFAGTHNSASGADFRFREDDFTERCSIADQTTSLQQQLQDGIRFFEFSPCNKGCPLFKSSRASRTRIFSPFKSFHAPIFKSKMAKGRGDRIPKFSDWPGFCTKNRCTMPLCRAIKIFKRWNLMNPTEVITLHFGPEQGGGGEGEPLDEVSWGNYNEYLVRYLKYQFPTQLNSYFLGFLDENGE